MGGLLNMLAALALQQDRRPAYMSQQGSGPSIWDVLAQLPAAFKQTTNQARSVGPEDAGKWWPQIWGEQAAGYMTAPFEGIADFVGPFVGGAVGGVANTAAKLGQRYNPNVPIDISPSAPPVTYVPEQQPQPQLDTTPQQDPFQAMSQLLSTAGLDQEVPPYQSVDLSGVKGELGTIRDQIEQRVAENAAQFPQAPVAQGPAPIDMGFIDELRRMYEMTAPNPLDEQAMRSQELLSFLQGLAGGSMGGSNAAEVISGAGAGGLGQLINTLRYNEAQRQTYDKSMQDFYSRGMNLEQGIEQMKRNIESGQNEASWRTQSAAFERGMSVTNYKLREQQLSNEIDKSIAELSGEEAKSKTQAYNLGVQDKVQQKLMAVRASMDNYMRNMLVNPDFDLQKALDAARDMSPEVKRMYLQGIQQKLAGRNNMPEVALVNLVEALMNDPAMAQAALTPEGYQNAVDGANQLAEKVMGTGRFRTAGADAQQQFRESLKGLLFNELLQDPEQVLKTLASKNYPLALQILKDFPLGTWRRPGQATTTTGGSRAR